jgi:hypothetical protein
MVYSVLYLEPADARGLIECPGLAFDVFNAVCTAFLPGEWCGSVYSMQEMRSKIEVQTIRASKSENKSEQVRAQVRASQSVVLALVRI